MFFNSINFAIFLPIVFFFYWFVTNKNLKTQNILLISASYFFYACWDWRFLFLLIFSTFLDYFTGLKIVNSQNKKSKKFWFWLSISINIGLLGVFKYFNFFASSFTDLLSEFGFNVNPITLNIILPVGISFYTFHGLSYVIDIYKGRIESEKNFIDYALFVSFFPLLVAGPIERATHLLPQIQNKRTFNYNEAVDGMRQILWGLFKKVVIADQCAEYVNDIFNNYTDHSGGTLFLGALFFTFQIYGDFSGYSDMAIGIAKLFGIKLLKNFSFPYFSRDIAEFWRRWHISLSTWFRDYLYIPLGGSRGGTWMKIRNTFIIFIVSGLWHGANWTFIAWGFLNALFIMPSIVFNTNRNNLNIVAQGKTFPNFKEFVSIFVTFHLTLILWIFFRAENITQAFKYVQNIFSKNIFLFSHPIPWIILGLIGFFMALEWIGREGNYALERLSSTKHRLINIVFYYCLIILIFVFAGSSQQFIYFQF